MAKDYTITTEHITRIWLEESGECWEVKPDDDHGDLVQINYFSQGTAVQSPDSTFVLMPEVAEHLWCVLRDAAIQARAVQRQMEGESKNG